MAPIVLTFIVFIAINGSIRRDRLGRGHKVGYDELVIWLVELELVWIRGYSRGLASSNEMSVPGREMPRDSTGDNLKWLPSI